MSDNVPDDACTLLSDALDLIELHLWSHSPPGARSTWCPCSACAQGLGLLTRAGRPAYGLLAPAGLGAALEARGALDEQGVPS